jgi:hypothetical protein
LQDKLDIKSISKVFWFFETEMTSYITKNPKRNRILKIVIISICMFLIIINI